jgi:quinol monooxygenase YgiN
MKITVKNSIGCLFVLSIFSFTQKSFTNMESQKISVLLRFKAKAGQTQALASHLVETANQLTISEEGTEIFTVSTTPIDPEAVYVYEVYSSAEAKALHETGDVYNAARAKTNEFVDGPAHRCSLNSDWGKRVEINKNPKPNSLGFFVGFFRFTSKPALHYQ